MRKPNKNNEKYELIAPAGDMASFVAAVEAGADAVYFGLKKFNMRDAANNFELEDLKEMQKYNVKKYLTLNTIIYDRELDSIEKIVKEVKNYVDAIVCWDPATIQICSKYNIPPHISTQASVANTEAAKFYKKLGVERVTLARELNFEQIKRISKILPVSCFCHGALCVSVSGRCFTSQFLHSKSANRGKCQHPCRKSYTVRDDEGNELKLKNNYVMSAKDLCTLPFIEKMKEAGITSFKIEGRNRNPEYISEVTKVYREALDNKLSKKKKDEILKKLKEVYNRKFSSGFYLGLPTIDDFTDIEGSNNKKIRKVIGQVINYFKDKKVAVVKIWTGEIKKGDELIIIGNTTGIKKFKVRSMERKHKKINKAKKGEEVAIKTPLVREKDTVYKKVVKDEN